MNKKLQVILMEVRHDRKKFVMMCTLLLVGLLLWARLLILQDVPKTGFADPAVTGTAGVPATSTNAKPQSERLDELPIVYMDTETQLARNFFGPLLSSSMQSEDAIQVPSLDAKSQSERSEDEGAELLKRREAFDADVQRLKLESVILGRAPVAVINGKVLRVGQVIDGFVLENVSDRSVIVRRGEFRVDLKMEKPKSGG